MPGGDGSGPNGMGPMTGRGAGFCAGFNVPGFANRGQGGGFGGGFGGGRGQGRGRGFRNRFYAAGPYGWQREAQPYAGTPVPPIDPRGMLERRKAALEAQLKEVNEALSEGEA